MLTCTEAALRFQPSKRPQQQQKPKAKVLAKSAPAPFNTSSPDKEGAHAASPVPAPVHKTTLADWTADDDNNDFYTSGPRGRGGRNKKRKKNKEKEEALPQNWDDIYDPTRPNIYEAYKDSDERVLEIRDWRDRIYAHRDAKRGDSVPYESDESLGPAKNSTCFVFLIQYCTLTLPRQIRSTFFHVVRPTIVPLICASNKL
jgi:splicing factor 45